MGATICIDDNNNSPYSVGGLGTYYSYLDGSRIKIDFTPDSAVGVAHSVSAQSSGRGIET